MMGQEGFGHGGNAGHTGGDAHGTREKLLDRIMNLTQTLLFMEDADEMLSRMGKMAMELFPIRGVIVYARAEGSNEVVPKVLLGYPEERAREIKEKVRYSIEQPLGTGHGSVSIGRFSKFFSDELADKSDVRDYLTALGQESLDRPREHEDAWHPRDRACFLMLDRSGGEIGAVEVTATTTGRMLDDEMIEGLELLASIGSVAMELCDLRGKEQMMLESQEERAAQMSRILDVTRSILSLSDPKELMDRVMALIRDLFGFGSCAIAIYDETEGCFRWMALSGYSPEECLAARQMRVPKEIVEYDTSDEFRIGYLAHFIPAEKVVEDDLKYYFFSEKDREKGREQMKMPREAEGSWHPLDDINFAILDRKGRIVGVIAPDDPRDGKIPQRESIELMEIFVSLVAIALENAKLYSETTRARDEVHVLNRLMFHDLMNYNLAIKGYLDLAISSSEEKRQRFVGKAIDQIDQTAELIGKVRKLSLIRSMERNSLLRIDLASTIKTQASKTMALFPSKKMSYRFDLGSKGAFVMANDLLPDLFHNIIMNAIKFDAHEVVEIEISLDEWMDESDGGQRRYWKVSIADHGPGIPDEKKEMIFRGELGHGSGAVNSQVPREPVRRKGVGRRQGSRDAREGDRVPRAPPGGVERAVDVPDQARAGHTS